MKSEAATGSISRRRRSSVRRWIRARSLLAHHSDFFFPVGAGYCLLVMTNLVYNSFGGDGGGIQSFLMAPVPFRQIVFAKNLSHLTVLATEVSILLLGVSLIFEPPHAAFLALTFCWYLFAAPLNFGAGNLLSIYSPKPNQNGFKDSSCSCCRCCLIPPL